MRHQLLVFETAFVRHLILARDRFLSLSLLLWHIVMLRTAVGPIADSCFANLGWVPIAKPVFGYLQNGLGQEHSSRQVRFILSQRQSVCALSYRETNPCHLQGPCLPGVG